MLLRSSSCLLILAAALTASLQLPPSMSPPPSVTITVDELKEILKNDPSSIKLLDASWKQIGEPIPWKEFREKYYGKFEEVMELKKNPDFEKDHIHGARHFSLDAASFLGEFQKASLYPPAEFAAYPQILGLSKDDVIVVYGRGGYSGMLFASRAWFLLKYYGAKHVRVLEGGLEHWKATGGETTGEETPAPAARGTWQALPVDSSRLLTFEELENATSPINFDHLENANFLDARPAGQFNGSEPLAFDPNGAPGYHLAGSKSVPIPDVLAEDGKGLKTGEEIRKALAADGFKEGAPTATSCNAGTQASLLALALAKAGIHASMFNGSLTEVSRRSPERINGI